MIFGSFCLDCGFLLSCSSVVRFHSTRARRLFRFFWFRLALLIWVVVFGFWLWLRCLDTTSCIWLLSSRLAGLRSSNCWLHFFLLLFSKLQFSLSAMPPLYLPSTVLLPLERSILLWTAAELTPWTWLNLALGGHQVSWLQVFRVSDLTPTSNPIKLSGSPHEGVTDQPH